MRLISRSMQAWLGALIMKIDAINGIKLARHYDWGWLRKYWLWMVWRVEPVCLCWICDEVDALLWSKLTWDFY